MYNQCVLTTSSQVSKVSRVVQVCNIISHHYKLIIHTQRQIWTRISTNKKLPILKILHITYLIILQWTEDCNIPAVQRESVQNNFYFCKQVLFMSICKMLVQYNTRLKFIEYLKTKHDKYTRT